MATKQRYSNSYSFDNVAIIGFGPSGLVAAKRLQECNVKVTIFERKSGVGGLWYPPKITTTFGSDCATPKGACISKSTDSDTEAMVLSPSLGDHGNAELGSACYESLITNIPRPLMTFHSFEWPVDTGLFVPRETVLRYLTDCSIANGLERAIRYNTNVIQIRNDIEGRWTLELELTERFHLQNRAPVLLSEEKFDAVVVCNGHYDQPDIPSVPGLDQWMLKWPGRVLHSRDYRYNIPFVDKNVLIVGCGVSAFDLSKDIAACARVAYRADRRRMHDDRPVHEQTIEQHVWSTVPKNVLKTPEVVRFEDVQCLDDIQEATIFLRDQTVLTGIDYVILCTGYRYHFPFFVHETTISHSHMKTQELPIVLVEGNQVRDLYLDAFYIPDPTIAFIGVPHNISTFRFFDLQASMVAAVFSGQAKLPTQEDMTQNYAKRCSELRPGKMFHSLGIRKEADYLETVATLCKQSAIVLSVVAEYKTVLEDSQKQAVRYFKERLLATTFVRNHKRIDIQVLVDVKAKLLVAELKRLDNDGAWQVPG